MKNWFNVKISIYLYLLVISIFTVFRAILFLTNLELVNAIGEDKLNLVLMSFLMGLRFDIVISGYLLFIPFLTFSILFVAKKKSNIIMQIMFYFIFVMFTIAFVICAIDIPYFNQFFSRFDVSAFQWIESPSFVFKMIIQEPRYWFILIPFSILIVLFFIGLKRIFNKFKFDKNRYFTSGIILKIFFSLLFAAIMFAGIRGRLQKKSPIRVGTAYFSNNPFINKAGLNPVFTFLRSYLDTFRTENSEIKLMNDEIAINNVHNYLNISKINENNPIARNISIADSVTIHKKKKVL
ncbi:MAG: hypothetical protein JXR51_11960 [Bacteroidales bacterium]|nr:hypothetical protein [Bacteroidales bacterium]MBN2757885.1 hypothetical protein [Bacteroidales bacterium]